MSRSGKAAKPTRSPTRPTPRPSRTLRELLAAGLALFALIVCGFLILRTTDGFLNKGYGVALFICAALFAGISFWAITPVDDQRNTFKQSGVRLAGGAAVGLVFAVFSWYWVDDLPQQVVVQLPPTVKSAGLRVTRGPGISDAEIVLGRNRNLLYVVFDGNVPKGTVTLRWFDIDSETGTSSTRLIVDRKGNLNE